MLAGGIVLLTRTPPGPLRTAGSVATVAAIPPLLFFVTFDDDAFPPYSTEAVLGVSAAAWLVLHRVGPAAGRTFPLGAGLIGAWLFLLQIVEEPFTAPFDVLFLFTFTFSMEEDEFGRGGGGDPFGTGFHVPDLETMALLSLLCGVAVVIGGRLLDRRGQRGPATAFTAASLPMLLVGSVLLIPPDGATVGGLVLAGAGGWLAYEGAHRSRRATCWVGALGAVVGVGMIVGDLAGDSATAFGLAAIMAGVAVVAAAQLVSDRLGEPDELVAQLPSGGSTQPSAPPPPPPEPPVAGG